MTPSLLPLLALAASAASLVMSVPHPLPLDAQPGAYPAPLRLYTAGYDATLRTYDLTLTPHVTLKEAAPPLSNKAGDGPSWITFSDVRKKHLRSLYVVSESDVGVVYDVDASRANPVVKPASENGFKTGGNGPVAADVAGNQLFVANYGGESVSIFDLSPSGSILGTAPHIISVSRPPSSPSGPITNRQDKSYPHDATASPDGRFVYINDLGSDVIHTLLVGPSASLSKKVGETKLPPGTGPRHLSFYKEEQEGRVFAYVSNELSTTVQAFEQHVVSGVLVPIGQAVSAAPRGTNLNFTQAEGNSINVAEIAVANDGRHVYVSTRGDEVEDHIAIFEREREDGSIRFVRWIKSGGRGPRHFSLSPKGTYLAVAHQGTANVVVHRLTHGGSELQKVAEVKGVKDVAYAGFAPWRGV